MGRPPIRLVLGIGAFVVLTIAERLVPLRRARHAVGRRLAGNAALGAVAFTATGWPPRR